MNELENYRREIDALDEKLIDLLVRRFQIVQAVGEYKGRTGTNVVQSERAEEVKNRVAQMAAAQGLSPDLVRKMYEMMIDHAHELEHKIVGDDAQ